MGTFSGDNPEDAQRAATKRVLRAGGDPYKMLGVVDGTTDRSTLKTARRQCALLLHPDKNHDPQATEAMKLLNQAFDILMALAPGQRWTAPGRTGPEQQQQNSKKPGSDSSRPKEQPKPQNNAEQAKQRANKEDGQEN
ncbi:hypothetical protein A4X13_0g9120 [Tilletia indica]|uniref:J domain-containing protein n=1 Tax=Tilletia indica TaxID=43049 RepID=A0A8T8SBC0_9BASI|nr:hypothetical protein A4X13_0g9120 [Tilletia indica]